MSVLRKSILFVSGLLLRSLLFFGFTALAAVMVLGNRDSVKNAMATANAYERFAAGVLESARGQAAADPNAIPLDDPQVAAILKKSLDPASLQAISEKAVDATYDWLEGKTASVEFRADISKNKQTLAAGMADYAVKRLAELPTCRDVPAEANIFRLTCNPAYLDIVQQRQLVYDAIMADDSVFKGTQLTAADLPKTQSGQPFYEAYPRAPDYYRWFTRLPWILLGLSLPAAVAVWRYSPSRRRGLKAVAASLLGTAVVLAVAPLLYMYVLPAAGVPLPGTGGSGTISAISNDVLANNYTALNGALINIAIQLGLLGALLYLAARYLKPSGRSYAALESESGLASSLVQPPIGDSSTGSAGAAVPVQSSEVVQAKNKKASPAAERKFRKMQ